MIKCIFKILTILLLVVAFVFALCACNDGTSEKGVASIQVVQGSFKESYRLDERLDLTNAKILVTYVDGKTANVSVSEDMISGFDTSKTTTDGVLTITYKGVKVRYTYKVTNSIAIETSFRYSFVVSESAEHPGLDVQVKALNASKVEEGVYATRFTLSTTGGMSLSNYAVQLGEGFSMETYSVSVNSIVFVIYSVDGYEPIGDGATLISIRASKPSVMGTLNIQNASISNGIADYVVPAITYTYGG